jgi:molybdate transport system substrate-binding protein
LRDRIAANINKDGPLKARPPGGIAMRSSAHFRNLALGFAATLLLAGSANAAEVRVMISGGLTAAYTALVPEFEKATGNKVLTAFGPSMGTTVNAIPMRLGRGEPADVLIMVGYALGDLAKQGKVVAGTSVDLVTSGIGVAVKAGAPKPDISTPQALKAALLAAKSVAYTDPKSGGASGIHFVKVLTDLGIADAINAKAKFGQGGLTGEFIVKGEADMAVQQLPELKSVPGIDIVGPLPAALQSITLLSSGVLAGAKTPDTARALVNFLRSPEAVAVLKDKGLEPGGPAAKGAI